MRQFTRLARIAANFAFILSLVSLVECKDPSQRPNILLLLADDMGYGDLGCYGNHRASTPNIDRLAEEGLRFDRMYSESSDTSSRTALLTGMYPVRLGMIRDSISLPLLRGPNFHSLAQPGGVKDLDTPLLSNILKSNGYKTAFVGEWGLGYGQNKEHLPGNIGFDVFYGTPGYHSVSCSSDPSQSFTDSDMVLTFCKRMFPVFIILIVFSYIGLFHQRTIRGLILLNVVVILSYKIYLSFTFFNHKSCILMDGDEIIEQPYKDDNMTLRMTQRALNFLSDSATGSQPFFLFMSYLQVHLPSIASPFFKNRTGKGLYYDSLSELDWSVGKVLQQLKQLQIDENTLVIFTSDNGPVLTNTLTKSPFPEEETGSTIMKRQGDRIRLKGEKYSVWEGGIRVPAIFTWKGVITGKQTAQAVTSLMDILPTIQDIIDPDGVKTELDGKSLIPFFTKSYSASQYQYLLHYCENGGVAAVTSRKYKIHFTACNGDAFDPPLFFDMERDPSESISSGPPGRKEIIQDALKEISRHTASFNVTPSLFTHLLRPWLYPCSNFPFCQKSMPKQENFDDLFT